MICQKLNWKTFKLFSLFLAYTKLKSSTSNDFHSFLYFSIKQVWHLDMCRNTQCWAPWHIRSVSSPTGCCAGLSDRAARRKRQPILLLLHWGRFTRQKRSWRPSSKRNTYLKNSLERKWVLSRMRADQHSKRTWGLGTAASRTGQGTNVPSIHDEAWIKHGEASMVCIRGPGFQF